MFNDLRTWFIAGALGLLTACNNSPEYQESLSPVVLENGIQVSTCHDYEQMRAAFQLSETLGNQLTSAEYLVCSLAVGVTANPNKDKSLRAIFHGLDVRALPTSLGPLIEKGVSLSSAGFQLWLERSMLTYNDDGSQLQIQYKGQLKNGNHLIWVSDRSVDGNYASFFPAIVVMEDGKAVGAAPLYASGF
ncbi:hypothetical protein ACFO4O_14945 [Glaciecola siphonariae]|uniref:Lipoprotein n=1 Tax=Glaciecola siphonariae TaxID=521012 RepID=A0ABV9LY48_9ALTE